MQTNVVGFQGYSMKSILMQNALEVREYSRVVLLQRLHIAFYLPSILVRLSYGARESGGL